MVLKKVVDLKELVVRIVVAVGLRGLVCVCVRELKRERMCFTAAFRGKLLSTVFEGYIGLIGKCLLLHAWFP